MCLVIAFFEPATITSPRRGPLGSMCHAGPEGAAVVGSPELMRFEATAPGWDDPRTQRGRRPGWVGGLVRGGLGSAGAPRWRRCRARPCGCGARTATSVIQIFPSPIFSVRAAAARASATASAEPIVDQDLDLHLGDEVDRVLSAPVHLGVTRLASEALHLAHGHAVHAGPLSASFTSSSLKGLMTAVMSFNPFPPISAPTGLRCRCCRRSLHARPGRGRCAPSPQRLARRWWPSAPA